MEAILIALAPQIIPVVGALLVGLASWGIAILKKKVKMEAGKVALDQVDQIIGTVVGNLAQTTAKGLRAAAKDGKLTSGEKKELKDFAVKHAKYLISDQVSKAASASIDDLTAYINHKVEEKVLATKVVRPAPN